MNHRALLAGMLNSTLTRIDRVLADLSEDDAGARPQGLTPIVWQAGHIAFVDSRVLVRAGVDVDVPSSYEELFTTGTGNADEYPTLASIRPVLVDLNSRLHQFALETDLAQPLSGTRSYASIGEGLVFLTYHRGYHVGKIATLRALIARERTLA